MLLFCGVKFFFGFVGVYLEFLFKYNVVVDVGENCFLLFGKVEEKILGLCKFSCKYF